MRIDNLGPPLKLLLFLLLGSHLLSSPTRGYSILTLRRVNVSLEFQKQTLMNRVTYNLSSKPVIFNTFHLLAHKNKLLKFFSRAKAMFFCQPDKNFVLTGNFDSFTSDRYCCVGCCDIFI